jgi:glycosyltransferase involved in cell wall biosynthesis
MIYRKKWPLVSVCVTSFNRLEYLKQTLESFRKCCTYPNLEYIVVDNCSDPEVIEYINKLDFIDEKIMNERNMGHGYAMNQARRKANGEYYFNLENDWLFFYRSDWLERGVVLFEKDGRGEPVAKQPLDLPLGLIKYRLGADIKNYTNNPSLVSREVYTVVGEYTQYGREYKYVSESFGKLEKEYISRFGIKFACSMSETPCVIHIGGFTTNPNYGNRGRKSREELDALLASTWKNGKWWFTWHYYTFTRKMQIRRAIRKYRKFESYRNDR